VLNAHIFAFIALFFILFVELECLSYSVFLFCFMYATYQSPCFENLAYIYICISFILSYSLFLLYSISRMLRIKIQINVDNLAYIFVFHSSFLYFVT